ncbi:MAG: MaoC/PaaZ C-terminal domain-containing protein [Anaerolineae bacterium]
MGKALARNTGLFFEEFVSGDAITSVGRTVTETDIVNFAALSGDWNLIHTDAEYSRQSLFGERVAHGLLVLSIASGLAVRLGFMEDTVQAFMGMEWEFRGPVKIGDTVRLRATIEDKKAMPRLGGGFVTFKMQVLNQRDEIVQRGAWKVLVKSAPAPQFGQD